MTEWAPGYYIAHNWSDPGKKILTRPRVVRIKNTIYRYDGEMMAYPGDTYSLAKKFIGKACNIGFQTCYGDGYLILRYRPVG